MNYSEPIVASGIYMDWQRRMRAYRRRLRATKMIATGLVISGCILMLIALVFQKGWTAPVAVVFVTFMGLVTLYGYFLELNQWLKCPSCGSTLQHFVFQRAVGNVDIAVCRHCAPTFSESKQTNDSFIRDTPQATRAGARKR